MKCGRGLWYVSVSDCQGRGYQLLIFDWDGTLVDSIGRIVAAMHLAADACELPRCTDDQVRGIIGLGLPEAIRCLYPDMHDALRAQRLRQSYSENYLALESEPSALFHGVAEGLEAFRAEGYRLAVATQARRFKRYPSQAMASGWEGSADIRVEVGSDGRPRAVTVARSSGREMLDRAALVMIDAGALRARLPDSLRGKAFAVVLPVVFNLEAE